MIGCGLSVGLEVGRGSTADRTPRGMPHRRRGRKANRTPCTPDGGAALLRTPDRRWNHSAEHSGYRVFAGPLTAVLAGRRACQCRSKRWRVGALVAPLAASLSRYG